jgi:hypothetical protein
MSSQTAYLNDTTTVEVPLLWRGVAFMPGEEWSLIFTAKQNAADPDSEAVIQKASGAGITARRRFADVELVPADSDSLDPCVLFCDIQGQHLTTGQVRTFASFELSFVRDITRETSTSVPVHTTQTPLPFVPAAYALLVADEADRLSRSASEVAGRVVVQETPNSAWVLVADGDPSNPADWVSSYFSSDVSEGALRYDDAQSLTVDQKLRAQRNLRFTSGVHTSAALLALDFPFTLCTLRPYQATLIRIRIDNFISVSDAQPISFSILSPQSLAVSTPSNLSRSLLTGEALGLGAPGIADDTIVGTLKGTAIEFDLWLAATSDAETLIEIIATSANSAARFTHTATLAL